MTTILLSFQFPSQLGELAPYLGVAALSGVKYFIGVMTGLASNYSLTEMLLTVGLGGVVSTLVYIYFGQYIRYLLVDYLKLKKKKKSFAKRRRIVKAWRRYGLAGAAFLIPIISPQVAIGIAISFREKPMRIFSMVSLSIVFWIIVSFMLKESFVLQFAKVAG